MHRIALGLLACFCVSSAQAAAGAYSIVALGSLSGATGTVATDLNNPGSVVGESDKIVGQNLIDHAFLWSEGTMSPLLMYATAEGINDTGIVVGHQTVSGRTRAFVWSGGGTSFLPAGYQSAAYAVSGSGQVVGYSTVGGGAAHAVLWQGGTMTDLGTLGGVSSLAWDINDRDQVVGESNFSTGSGLPHAFLWQSGTMTDLCPQCAGMSRASAVNDTGQAVGVAAAPDSGAARATLWADGQMTDIGTLGGHYSYAYDINEAGDAVGSSTFSVASSAHHAFLWRDGTLHDLNDLLDPGAGWTLNYANAINDRGQIVGVGLDPQGSAGAFLLTPVPEPATWLLFVAGVAGLGLRRAGFVSEPSGKCSSATLLGPLRRAG